MKIFILFALASVSVCWDYDGNSQRPIICGPDGSGGGGYGSSGPGEGGPGPWVVDQEGGLGGTHSSGDGGSSSGGTHSSGDGGSSSGGTHSSGGAGSSSSLSSSSSSSTFQCTPIHNKYADDDSKCLKYALENSPELLKAGEQLVCKHKEHKVHLTEEYFNELDEELQTFVGCVGCRVGSFLGLSKKFGQAGAGVGNTAARLTQAMDGLTASLGLVQPVLDLVCELLGPTLASDCTRKLLSKDVPELVENLKKTVCKEEEDVDVKEVVEILKDVGCVGDKVLGLDDVLEKFTEDVGEHITPAVNNLVNVLKTSPVVSGLWGGPVCGALETVDQIVNGGDGGILGGLGGKKKEGGGGLLSGITDLLKGRR